MDKKGQINGTMMVVILITLIIGMIALSISWGVIEDQRTTTAVSGDLFAMSNITCTRITNNCIVPSSAVVLNITSGTTSTGNFTECGGSGDIFGLQASTTADADYIGETFNASYSNIACTPITGIASSIISYVPVLMAVALLVFVAFFMK